MAKTDSRRQYEHHTTNYPYAHCATSAHCGDSILLGPNFSTQPPIERPFSHPTHLFNNPSAAIDLKFLFSDPTIAQAKLLTSGILSTPLPTRSTIRPAQLPSFAKIVDDYLSPIADSRKTSNQTSRVPTLLLPICGFPMPNALDILANTSTPDLSYRN